MKTPITQKVDEFISKGINGKYNDLLAEVGVSDYQDELQYLAARFALATEQSIIECGDNDSVHLAMSFVLALVAGIVVSDSGLVHLQPKVKEKPCEPLS